MKRYAFDARIVEAERGGAWIEFPYDARTEFGTGGRVPVRATFDGTPYRGSLAPMGGCHVLGVLKDIRKAIGKGVGDTVRVVIERDSEERTVDVPADLAAALEADLVAKAAFDRLSYTRRKEHARAVAEAKAPETRARRVGKLLDALREGRSEEE